MRTENAPASPTQWTVAKFNQRNQLLEIHRYTDKGKAEHKAIQINNTIPGQYARIIPPLTKKGKS